MPALPTIPTISDGPSASSQVNQLGDALRFLFNRPHAELRQASAQSVNNSTDTAITFDTHDIDSDYLGGTGHSDSTNNSRYTANYAGWYRISGGVSWAINTTGVRLIEWSVNGILVNGSAASMTPLTGVTTRVASRGGIEVFLAAGDYVEMLVFQSSGGALSTAVTTLEQARMSVRWCGTI